VSVLSRRLHFTNSRTTNFYYSFLFLSPERRRAIEAVYAFARRGDDAVDAARSPVYAARQLDQYRKDLDVCYGDQSSSLGDGLPAELEALREAVQRFRIPRRHFDELILGFEMDLNGTRYATVDELSLYCYRVASTIGLIAIEIFGYQNPRTRDYAINLGMALQFVNILRDLGNDARRGRVYIPQGDLERFQVPVQALLEGHASGHLNELVEFEAGRARNYFKCAREALPAEDRHSMLPAEIMAAIYWRLLGRIARGDCNVFGQRAALSRPLKLWTALSVYLGTEWFR
jgi:15-cis-phytoene synthase